MSAIGGNVIGLCTFVFTVYILWLEAAIKESDGLIAVISEKYMHSTYCNNGISLCAQRYATHHRIVCRNGHGKELRTAALPDSFSRSERVIWCKPTHLLLFSAFPWHCYYP